MRRLAAAFVLIAGCALAAPAAEARQDDPRLKDLFAELKTATSSVEARMIETKIWKIWAANDDPRVDVLMDRGMNAMSIDDTDTALAAFNQAIKRDDGFAEAYNKRATVEFVRHDFAAMNKKAAALRAFEAALAIDPRLENVQRTVTELKQQLEGNPT